MKHQMLVMHLLTIEESLSYSNALAFVTQRMIG